MGVEHLLPMDFWKHPLIVQKYDSIYLDDLIYSDELPVFILRRHANGMFCLGLNGDTEHFRAYHVVPCFVQALIWLECGDRWIKDKWVSGVDADGKPIEPQKEF